MVAALSELEGSGATISVDTMRPAVLEQCLKFDIHAINDINGLADPDAVDVVGEAEDVLGRRGADHAVAGVPGVGGLLSPPRPTG